MAPSETFDLTFFDALPTPAAILSHDLVYEAVNPAFLAMTGKTGPELTGRAVFDVFPSSKQGREADAEPAMREAVARVLETGEAVEMPVERHDLLDEDGKYRERYWKLSMSPLKRDGAVGSILLLAAEATVETRRDHLAHARLRAASEVDIAFWEIDLVSWRSIRTDAVDRIFGFAPGEVGTGGGPFLARVHPDDRRAFMSDLARAAQGSKGDTFSSSHRLLMPDGRIRWIRAESEVLRPAGYANLHLVGMIFDDTDRRERERHLEEALKARELLLGEASHRIKNSLQLVVSVLNLEISRARGDDTRKVLEATSARIHAIAAIHDVLSLSDDDDLRFVAFDEHLRHFCETLAKSAGADARRITVKVDAAPVRLSVEKAITLSLAVNELMANSFKYAFPTGGGRIDVQLSGDEGRVKLLVSDLADPRGDAEIGQEFGGGLKPDSGLGTRLVQASARQLGGELRRVELGGGWTSEIEFPL